jgi:hypothetical protein
MPSGVSDAPRSSARRASLTFFLDKVAQLLRAAGANVEVHLDHFGGDIADIEWIPEVARRNWVLITKDQNIRRNPIERALVQCLPGMVRRAAGRSGPFLFTISRSGVFSKLI